MAHDHHQQAQTIAPELQTMIGIVAAMMAVAALLVGVWYYYRPAIVVPAFWLSAPQLALIDLLVDDQHVTAARRFIRGADPWLVNQKQFFLVLETVGRHIRWLALPLGAIILWRGWMLNGNSRYRTVHSLNSFIRFQEKAWHAIRPLKRVAGKEEAPGKGWGFALQPKEWARLHAAYEPGESGSEPKLDREKAASAFAGQLSAEWVGPKALAPALRLLLAAFLLFAAGKQGQSKAVLAVLSSIAGHTNDIDGTLRTLKRKAFHDIAKGDWIGYADRVLQNPEIGQAAIDDSMRRHGFVETAFVRLLEDARAKRGVLASAAFLWLKGYNRGLFYALNNAGRKTFHPEAAGVLAHYKAERAAGTLLVVPNVQQAVLALEEAVLPRQEEATAVAEAMSRPSGRRSGGGVKERVQPGRGRRPQMAQ